jgi:hypothetical protein
LASPARIGRRDFAYDVSQIVIDEFSVGDEFEVKKWLEIVKPLDMLAASAGAEVLTAAIVTARILPENAVRDAAHIAVATAHGVEYLLTWDCRHLGNAQIFRRVERICSEHGFVMPLICTPEELIEDTGDEG